MSIFLACINYFYTLDKKSKNNELYTSTFTVKDFTVLNPKDSYFYDINNLLEKHQIFVTPGSIFGSNGEGYIRLSLCSNEQEIIKAIERL